MSIVNGRVDWTKFSGVSPSAVKLLKRMFELDVEKRIEIKEVCEDEWVCGEK